jgi:hypothetical protein
MLGKTPLTKKAHKKSLTCKSKVKWQAQTARLAREKMVQHRLWARSGFYRKGGRVRKLAHAR